MNQEKRALYDLITKRTSPMTQSIHDTTVSLAAIHGIRVLRQDLLNMVDALDLSQSQKRHLSLHIKSRAGICEKEFEL